MVSVPASESTDTTPEPLVLRCGQLRHRLDPDAGEVTVGRAPTCTVHLDFKWLSRIHLRLAPHAGQWLATDSSRNGIFVDGQRVSTVPVSAGTVINLGDPEGLALSFHDPSDSTPLVPGENEDLLEVTDPGMVRAGRAVAERRKALGLTQRDMAASGVLNAGALVSFEKARSWPHERTLAKLEDALQWPTGTITAIRHGVTAPDETTQVVATSVATPLITQSIQLALNGIDAAISALPAADSADFAARSDAILADLRALQTTVSAAIDASPGLASLVIALGATRKRYDDLLMRVATTDAATLGQRLYAARRRTNLTEADIAQAAGLPVEIVAAAEAEQPVTAPVRAALEALLQQLG
jgi:transcriptional regulator with XRE-family HTH domain